MSTVSRYSQSLANGKRKEDRQPAATAIVDSMANEANSGDKSGKKVFQDQKLYWNGLHYSLLLAKFFFPHT